MTQTDATMQQGALSGLLVIETAHRAAGEYAAKLLADLGAEVIKVEPPEGAATRRMGPFKDGESTLFHYLNANKKSVTLDLADSGGRALLDKLLARANGLVDDHGGIWTKANRLGPDDLAKTHEHLAHCIITPFGQGAPPEWQKARPINVMNAGGWAWHSPSETAPDKPPLKGAGRFLPEYEAGIDAALALCSSLLRQRRTGKGQFIDISEVEVQLNRVDCVLGRMLAGDIEPSPARTAYDMGGPGTSFACADGHIYMFMTTRGHWKALCELMGNPEWAKDFREDWLEFDCTPDNVALFRGHFAEWALKQHKLPITEAAQKAGIAMVPVNTAADLPFNEQLAFRGFFQSVNHPQFGKLLWPTAPYSMSATPVQIRTMAPQPGANNHELETPDAND